MQLKTGKVCSPVDTSSCFKLQVSAEANCCSKMNNYLTELHYKRFGIYATVIVIFTYNVLLQRDVECSCKKQVTECDLFMALPFFIIFVLMLRMEKKFWRTCKCSCRPCGCKSKYVWKDKCCSTLVCVVIHPVIRAFLISLLWVVSVLIDGDWYVCCRNYHSEHPQLACKNQDNITAEEKAFSAEMKNFSKVSVFYFFISL